MEKSSSGLDHLKLLTKNKHSIVCDAVNSNGEDVIVKTLRTDVAQDWAIERLCNEALLLQRLTPCEGVPTFIDFFWLAQKEGKPRPVLVTEKMSGITLHELRKQTPEYILPPQECITLIQQIGNVLAHVHNRDLVHRDIKLGNILVTPDWHVSIIDWGTAAPTNAKPTGSHVIGTAQFMSYEQITNQPLDARTDIYSLGVLMTLLAYGEHLTPRYVVAADGTQTQRTSDEIADQVAKGETIKYHLLPSPRSVHEQTLQNALRKMTRWDKSKRFQTMQSVVREVAL